MEISPAYVLQVEEELISGNFSEAIELCSMGIEAYPDYPLGFVLLTEAYDLSGDTVSADLVFNGSFDLFPGNKIFLSLKKYFDETGHYSAIIPNKIEDENENIFGKFQNSISQSGFAKPRPEDIPEEIEDITERNPELPVSESLAELLAKQGKISESIDMYLKLIEQNPDKTDFYQNKLESIKLIS